jgi:hypothetical protein
MNRKIGKRTIAAAIIIVTIVALGQPVHAQPYSVNTRPDRASYVPGDSGTLTVTIVNTGTQVIQLNNLTVYYPWAGFGPDGKWQGNQSATYSNQFIGAPGGTSSTTFTTSFQFTIPTWYGTIRPTGGCGGGTTTTRYSQQNNCIVVGSNAGNRYELADFSPSGEINMALATYTPISIVSQAIPIATLVVLVVATAFLALVWTSTRRAAKK